MQKNSEIEVWASSVLLKQGKREQVGLNWHHEVTYVTCCRVVSPIRGLQAANEAESASPLTSSGHMYQESAQLQ